MTYVRYENKWPNVKVTMERDLATGVREMGFAVEAQIVGNITRPPDGGPPLVDTGNYRRSWTTKLDGDRMGATIGTPVEYGVYLEYGYTQAAGQLYPKKQGNRIIGWGRTSGRMMPARKHVRRAAEDIATRASEYFRGRR